MMNSRDIKNHSTKGANMRLPKINETVDTKWALELCEAFKLDYLVKRIKNNEDQFISWKFDGVSCLPESWLKTFFPETSDILTYQCALPHDLCYAYGEHDNDIEKERVDLKFYSDLVTKAKMDKFLAKTFFHAVRIGGIEELGLSFSWGFARKKN